MTFTSPPSFTTRPTLRGSFGMVSSTHWLASQSAMRMLELGGNAADGAVAAAFVLHVVEPHLNGPGGDAPIIYAGPGEFPQVLSGQGPAPAGATIEHYHSEGLDLVPGSGPLAAVIPGAVEAWLRLLEEKGSLPLREILDPAIGYARFGHAISPDVVKTVVGVSELFRTNWTTSADLWLSGGAAPVADSTFTNPAWADTLSRLVDEGEAAGSDRAAQVAGARRAWSQGFVAEAVDAFSRKPFVDSSGSAHAGLITADDMAGFTAPWETPAQLDFAGHTIVKTRAWSQGPALLQTLAILDALDDETALDPATEHGIHHIAEALKLAFADREAWYGDVPDVPLDTLLSKAYATERAALIGADASGDLRPGSPDGRPPLLADLALASAGKPFGPTDATTGEPTVASNGVTRGDTCHVDVVDRWGGMVSATPSGGWLQSSPTIPELGFPLGSRGQMFWLQEGLASSLAPGRRPRTTLTPTMLVRDGVAVLACGSPGGDQQEQWQLMFLLRHLAGGFTLQQAIDAPSWHTDSFPGSFYPRQMTPAGLTLENRIDPDVIAALAARGHQVELAGAWTLGRLCAVSRDPENGQLAAGANPRGMHGYAVGR
ncbi:MAG TPA: gamma-glutamyltransferase [Actinopolymorphaceae bacterium]|jgi:gamma-glutamyltranspeptidase/glutathione hydrolase